MSVSSWPCFSLAEKVPVPSKYRSPTIPRSGTQLDALVGLDGVLCVRGGE